MKIFHVITGLKNAGAEAILYRVVSDKTSLHEHYVLSLSDDGFYGNLLRSQGIKVTSLRINSFSSLTIGFIKLFKLIKSNKPDVVQTWMYHADILGGLAAKFTGIKKIYWGVHSTFLNPEETKFFTKLAVKASVYLSYFVPLKIICCSEVAFKSHKEIGYDANKMVVINNGFDTNKFSPDQNKRNLIRKSLNIDHDIFVLGMIARWHPVKDHKTLLCALQKITSSSFKWKCLLVGDGMSNDNLELQSLINEKGLRNYIVCLGARQDVADVLNALDVHLLSSSSESFGNVTAEAMASSVPCIMTNVGVANKLLSELGWIVQPKNFIQLAETIEQVYLKFRDEKSWLLQKSSCREKISNEYSIEFMIQSYTDCWS